jgi:hypothetical protein
MTKPRDIASRMTALAPWLTLAVLLGLSVQFPNRSEIGADAQQRKADIARAIATAPYFIGRWVGEDSMDQIPREAQTLLHPNAIMSRTYRSPAGPAVQVLIVHCGDARDMIGHYPPICYPSTGWSRVPVRGREDLVLSVNGRALAARQYEFRCATPRGRIEIIRVFSAFILPDGRVALDIDNIHRQSERPALSVQGVAQVQVITSAQVPLNEAIDAADEILGGMHLIFDALQLGRSRSHASAGPQHHLPAELSRGGHCRET